MNKELLNENLNLILEGLKTAIHTANAELPAILEEIVRWGVIKYSSLSIILLVFILLSVGLIIFLIKKNEEPGIYFHFLPHSIVFTASILLTLLVHLTSNLIKLLFALTSPKLYIINYLKDLIQ
jgi:hypothetical protein